jgi:hypothetical protein
LKDVIQKRTGNRRFAERWAQKWLVVNAKNRHTVIPADANVTLTNGLRLLMEYPMQAILDVAGRRLGRKFRAFVAPACPDACEILIMEGFEFPHVLRFETVDDLVRWLDARVEGVVHKLKEIK